MTHNHVTILADGTHLYTNGYRYKPVPKASRLYRTRKPDVPGVVLFNGSWVLPLELLDMDERGPFPETRPDTDAYWHVDKTRKCRCSVCLRPESEVWKDKRKRGVGAPF